MLIANGNFFYEIYNFVLSILDVLTIYIGILLCVAFYTLAERKFMGSVQRRLGPNVVGFMGLLQAFADALKLILKELVIPYRANKFLFVLAPFMFLTLALLGWAVVPIASDVLIADILYGLLFIYLISSLSVFGVIIAGWASNSKYPFLGALRSAAQMISYEVSMGFILIIISVLTGSFNFIDIVNSQEDIWLVFLLFPLFLMFLVSILAETNRAPFDLPEAEAELVAGYNLEYSGIMFAMFFLAEYSNMLLMSILTIHLFLGGWFFNPINTAYLFGIVQDIQGYFYEYLNNFIFNLLLYIRVYLKAKVITFLYFYDLVVYCIEEAKWHFNTIQRTQPYLVSGPTFIYFIHFFYFFNTIFEVPFPDKVSLEGLIYTLHHKEILAEYNLLAFKQNVGTPTTIFYNFNLLNNSYVFVGIKLVILSVFFVLTRAALPRYRYDQLMYIGWKSFLPVTLGYLLLIIGICIYFDIFPDTQGNPFLNFYKP